MVFSSGLHEEALHWHDRHVFVGSDYFRALFVHDIKSFVNGHIVVVGVTQEVPAFEFAGVVVINQIERAVAAVRRAGEVEHTKSIVGVEVALARLEVEVAIVAFEVDPLKVLALVEVIEVEFAINHALLSIGIDNIGRIHGDRRSDEEVAAVWIIIVFIAWDVEGVFHRRGEVSTFTPFSGASVAVLVDALHLPLIGGIRIQIVDS